MTKPLDSTSGTKYSVNQIDIDVKVSWLLATPVSSIDVDVFVNGIKRTGPGNFTTTASGNQTTVVGTATVQTQFVNSTADVIFTCKDALGNPIGLATVTKTVTIQLQP